MTPDGATRSAITHIYFALRQGEVSRFHRVTSDEVWNLYRGVGIRIYTWDGTEVPPVCTELSEASDEFCHIVSAGTWQAAEPIGDSVLVGCSVGPGFDFEDFELMSPGSAAATQLLSVAPDMPRLVDP